jgi:hypothetical protein
MEKYIKFKVRWILSFESSDWLGPTIEAWRLVGFMHTKAERDLNNTGVWLVRA